MVSMEKVIEKAKVLIEALPYIQKFRDRYVVVKLGGSMVGRRDIVAGILQDMVFMEQVGMRPVLVLGGGPLVSRKMKDLGMEVSFVDGRRVTDERVIGVACEVFFDELFPWVVETIEGFGGRAQVFRPGDEDVVKAERVADERLGLVGEPEAVDTAPIESAAGRYAICVLGPLCSDGDGSLLNVNADHIASAVAAALGAAKVVFLSDVQGVMRDPEDESTLFSTLHEEEVHRLIDEGVITGGMLPKVYSCLDALHRGVPKAHIVDGSLPHSLLLEIFTDKGIGTEIVK